MTDLVGEAYLDTHWTVNIDVVKDSVGTRRVWLKVSDNKRNLVCAYMCRHWYWRPSRRALYYHSRASTMSVGIKMFGSSAVNNSCPALIGLLAVQVALLYTIIAGRADCRARVRPASRKSCRLVERLTKKKSHFHGTLQVKIGFENLNPTRGLGLRFLRIRLDSQI